MRILFENENFLAVDKPAGWLSVPGREGERDPRPCVGVEVRKRHPGALPVHRLDLEVTGLLLFAKNPEAHRAANGWFEGRDVEKTYEAWTEGEPPASRDPQLWHSKLVRGKKRAFEADHGKPASTRATWTACRTLASGVKANVWKIEPLTGRSHQIRFELAKHGCPVLGDALYGARTPWRDGEIALRAVRLAFNSGSAAGDAARRLGLPAMLEAPALRETEEPPHA